MNPAYAHLVLNHLPVLGTWFGLLLLCAGVLSKSHDLKKTSLIVFVLCALVAIPVYLTGEPAESKIEGMPNVSEGLIEAHEAAAKISLVLVELLGLSALLCLVLLKRSARVASLALWGVCALTLLTGAAFIYTAKLGGQIRHVEVRDAIPGTGNATNSEASGLDEDNHRRDENEHDDN